MAKLSRAEIKRQLDIVVKPHACGNSYLDPYAGMLRYSAYMRSEQTAVAVAEYTRRALREIKFPYACNVNPFLVCSGKSQGTWKVEVQVIVD